MTRLFAILLVLTTLSCRGSNSSNDLPEGSELAPEQPETSGLEHAGVSTFQDNGTVVLKNGIIGVRVDLLDGSVQIKSLEDPRFLKATSQVVYVVGNEEKVVSAPGLGLVASQVEPFDDALGGGLAVTTERGDGRVSIVTTIELRGRETFITTKAKVIFHTAADGIRVLRISPLVADYQSGGTLVVGRIPAMHRILNNGYDLYFDFVAQVKRADEPNSIFFAPGQSSNWCMAIYDPESERAVIAGFLSCERGVGVVAVDCCGPKAVEQESAFSKFETISFYMDQGRKPIRDGQAAWLESEVAYLDFPKGSAQEGLEEFARRYATRVGKLVWSDVPSGWNSWGGGSASGGMGTGIDEQFILENLDLAAKEFKPFGMKYFMIDDGWQDNKGDWNSHPQRFPPHDGKEGMAWIAEEIRKRGMIPGIWISPFEVSKKSKIAQEHSDWWAQVSPLGVGLVPSDIYVPDLTRPEVLSWLERLIHKITMEWGYKWLKIDFSYYAIFTTNLYDSSVTPSEAYRKALSVIRETAGPDTFLLLVAATGLSYDFADGNRVTLDNMPWWGDDASPFEQGIKPTYATLSRRYYLNHNLWINHPDLLFFRSSRGLTFEESRTWASLVGLTGGIVKLGETFVAMHEHPEWSEVVRMLLPIYPRSARPLDLFEREYPEMWLMDAEREERKWKVLGLFNWGRNRDIGGPWEQPSERTFKISLASLGLDISKPVLVMSAWERTWKRIENGILEETLPARSARILMLRELPSEPEIVFTTRHLLGGAVEVHGEDFDKHSGTLRAAVDTVPGQVFTVFVADAGMSLITAEPSFETGQQDGIAYSSFVAPSSETQITFRFHVP